MRGLRRTLNLLLPLLGILVAFAGVLYLEGDGPTLFAVLGGILLVEAGVWNLANPFLPSARKYIGLREEVDGFIGRVRELNSAAAEARSSQDRDAWARYEQVLAGMHASVDRMGELAGIEGADEPTRATDQNPQR